MKVNESTLDRIIRVLVGIILAILFATHIVAGTLGIILLIIAAILLLTGLVGTCGIYAMLGISSCKTKTAEQKK